jgi:hypothetical protein
LSQTFGPDGTNATLSFWRTPTTFGQFTGTLSVRNDRGYEAAFLVTITSTTVLLRLDHEDPSKTELAIGGFNLADPILFRADVGGLAMVSPHVVETVTDAPSARLFYHGSDMGTFIADKIVVYGQAGDDLIQVNEDISIDAWLFGGAGNDILVGGAGNDTLVGGLGDDILYGFGGRDLVFGGLGADYVQGDGWSDVVAGGDSASDIVIGGYVSFDFDPALLDQLARQWGTIDSYASRIQTINNGSSQLRTNVTVFDDFSKNTVFGGADSDWLLGESTRDTFDTEPNETLN